MHSLKAHRVGRLFVAVLLLTACLTACLTAAADANSTPATSDLWEAPAFSLTPEALLATAEELPAEEGEDVQIFLRELHVRFEEDGSRVSTSRLVYRVLTAAGVENWGLTGGPWKPWHQERPTLRARVIQPDGTEHWLDLATVGERPIGDDADNILSDRRMVEAPLPGLTAGAVVEDSFERQDVRPYFAEGDIDSLRFAWYGVNVHKVRLVLDAPEGLSLRYKTQLLGDLEPQRTVREGRVVLTFEAGPLEGIESVEEMAPGSVPVWPQVMYSTGTSWAAVATHYHDLVEEQLAGMDLKQAVKRVLRGGETRQEKIARLLAWLHEEVRYTGLEFAEAAIIPRSPEETLKRGYGDCKDKSTLLVALLRTAGIPAALALLNTGPGPDVAPELAGLGFFNHAIVYVPGGSDVGPDVWIDPTDEFARAGELPSVDQGRLALIATPGTRELTLTPASGPEDNRLMETREIFLAADLGGARVVEATQYWGAFDRIQRHSYSQVSVEDLEEDFAAYMESTYSAEEFISQEIADVKDLSKPFELRLEAKKANIAFTDLARATVFLAPDSLLRELPQMVLAEEEDEEDIEDAEITASAREADLVLPLPYTAEHRYRIVPPDGYRPVSVLASEERKFGPATLVQEVREEEDGTLWITWRFDTGKRQLTPEEFETLKEGVQEVFAEEAIEVGFEQVGEAYLAAGQIPEALAEFDRLIAAAPERALPRTRRARALLTGGLGAEARREAAAAVELEPDLYLAHQALGIVHLRDLVGRPFRPGMEAQRAAEAFRKAVELEPDDENDRRNLALLLEHNEKGVQYGPGAPLEEAIEAHIDLCDDEEASICLEPNLLTLLAFRGRYEEMLERASKAGRDTDAFTLAALALTKSSEEAIRASRQIRGGDQLRGALAGAGQLLMKARHYPEAADLFAAAAKGAPDPAKVLSLVALLRKVRLFEDMEFSEDDPGDVVLKNMFAIIQGDLEAVEALLSEGARELPDGKLMKTLEEHLATAEKAARLASMSLPVLMELGLAGTKLLVDGDQDLGYRVRQQGNVAGSNSTSSYFMIQEKGKVRLAAGENLEDLGYQVLRFLDGGDLAAARQWLDWALELTPKPPAGDPYAGAGFFHLWTRGQEADAETLRAAAASLLVSEKSTAERGLALLEEARGRASEEERRPIEIALAQGYMTLERDGELLAMARSWLEENTDSAAAFFYLRTALFRQESWDALEKAAQARDAIAADDPQALRAAIQAVLGRGDRETARQLYRRLVDLGKAVGNDYNNLAWMDVADFRVTEETLEWAQQGVSRDGDRADLHTLATAYAQLGKSTEAREVVLQAMQEDDEPTSDDWYVFGLIAERYGVLDSAVEAYRKVEPPEDLNLLHSSTYDLAQRRLAELKEGLPAPWVDTGE